MNLARHAAGVNGAARRARESDELRRRIEADAELLLSLRLLAILANCSGE